MQNRQPAPLAWQPWSAHAFDQARREHKLILLSVQADFCHWCHVMDTTTYRDRAVVALLRRHFVLLRVDQAERPDLAARYENYGWPATALLTPAAEPIVTLRGHQPASGFLALLSSLVSELEQRGSVTPRTAPPTVTTGTLDLTRAHRAALEQLDVLYDEGRGGWGGPQKYPFSAPVQHALYRAHVAREPARLGRALHSLRGYAALIDPVAGGMFQYSTGAVWSAPHHEKLAEIQGRAMLDFAEAYRATKDRDWLVAGMRIAHYTLSTLRNEQGTFSASQAADVGTLGDPDFLAGKLYYARPAADRSLLAAPALNEHVYANLNGIVMRGLLALYRASAEPLLLEAVNRCQEALQTTHMRGAAFTHEAHSSGPLYLADQVEVIDALLALADATAEDAPRALAYRVMDFVLQELADTEHGGFYEHGAGLATAGVFARPLKPAADNAHFALLLLARARREHDEGLRAAAELTLRGQTDPAALRAQGRKVGDLLLALESQQSDHVLFSIVGAEDDPRTRALYETAYRSYVPNALLRVDEPGQGKYPYPGRPGLYLCSESACSSPVLEPEKLASALATFSEAAQLAR